MLTGWTKWSGQERLHNVVLAVLVLAVVVVQNAALTPGTVVCLCNTATKANLHGLFLFATLLCAGS